MARNAVRALVACEERKRVALLLKPQLAFLWAAMEVMDGAFPLLRRLVDQLPEKVGMGWSE